jgi:tripartite-type tricarboxylate transporter receptor subunit TctC
MSPTSPIRRALLAAAAAALAVAPGLNAQTAWPSKAVRIIVPFSAGSFTETAARAVGAELASQFGQAFIVETRGGAGSTLGTDVVAKAAPDGHTLLLTDNSFAVSSALYPKLPYDPEKDIVKVSPVAEAPAVIMVRQDLTAKTLKELVDLARRQPKALTFGSGGQGSSAHLAVELFIAGADVELIHIPYKGVAAALLDLIAGRIDVGLSSVGSATQHIKGGRVRGLAVAGRERHPLLPEVPTFAEAGFPEYNMIYWFGVMAPAGTPAAVLGQLQQGIARAVEQPKIRDAFAGAGVRAVASSSADFTRRVDDEARVWKRVIQRAGIKPE